MTNTESEPGASTCARLPDLALSLIEITGEDRLDWLQGQATNDLRGMSIGERRSFCLCQATGQIVAVCDLWNQPDRFLLVTETEAAMDVMKRVETMVILEDVVARDLTPDYSLVNLVGPGAEPPKSPEAIVLKNERLGQPALDIWQRTGQADPYANIPTLMGEDYEIARIESRTPKRGVDYTNKTLPPELGPDFETRHVSYNKGCYMGQEVLMRIHSRGHTNKTWVGLILDEPVQPGAKVSHASREDAGAVTSAAISPRFGPIASAMLRNEAAVEGAEVSIGAIKGTVRSLPLIQTR